MTSLQASAGLTQHDIDCQMARMRLFQQAVKALFKGLYCRQQPQTGEDMEVCKILLEWACVHEDFVGSDALPDVYQRQALDSIPIVCIPFVLREDLPSQEEAPLLHEVHAIGTCMLSEFLGLTHRLDNLLINSMYAPLLLINTASISTRFDPDRLCRATIDGVWPGTG